MGVMTQYEADQMADGPSGPVALQAQRSVIAKPAKPRKSDGSPKTKDPVQAMNAPATLPAPPTAKAGPTTVAADSMGKAKAFVIARHMSSKTK